MMCRIIHRRDTEITENFLIKQTLRPLRLRGESFFILQTVKRRRIVLQNFVDHLRADFPVRAQLPERFDLDRVVRVAVVGADD